MGAPAVWDILKKGAGKGVDGMVLVSLPPHAQHKSMLYFLLHVATVVPRNWTDQHLREPESVWEPESVRGLQRAFQSSRKTESVAECQRNS